MSSLKESVQRQFSSAAAHYSTSPVHAAGEDLKVMVTCAALAGTEHVLDAGCGAGHTALAFAPHVAQVVAYDFTAAMLQQVNLLAAQRSIANITPQLGDVEHLPFPNNTFDVVVSRYSAHHWPHPMRALREFMRVLKAGGQLLISDVIAPQDPTQDTFLQTVELLRDPSHVRDHSLTQWWALLEEAGFAAQTVYTWDIFLEFDAWVARMATPHLNIAMIKTLFDGAPGEVRAAMQLRQDYSFTIPGGLVRGLKSAQTPNAH